MKNNNYIASKPTTFIQRVGDAMELLCEERPSDRMIKDWVEGKNEDLQVFALEECSVEWAQGIAVIDAAYALARNPKEGEGHKT